MDSDDIWRQVSEDERLKALKLHESARARERAAKERFSPLGVSIEKLRGKLEKLPEFRLTVTSTFAELLWDHGDERATVCLVAPSFNESDTKGFRVEMERGVGNRTHVLEEFSVSDSDKALALFLREIAAWHSLAHTAWLAGEELRRKLNESKGRHEPPNGNS